MNFFYFSRPNNCILQHLLGRRLFRSCDRKLEEACITIFVDQLIRRCFELSVSTRLIDFLQKILIAISVDINIISFRKKPHTSIPICYLRTPCLIAYQDLQLPRLISLNILNITDNPRIYLYFLPSSVSTYLLALPDPSGSKYPPPTILASSLPDCEGVSLHNSATSLRAIPPNALAY